MHFQKTDNETGDTFALLQLLRHASLLLKQIENKSYDGTRGKDRKTDFSKVTSRAKHEMLEMSVLKHGRLSNT